MSCHQVQIVMVHGVISQIVIRMPYYPNSLEDVIYDGHLKTLRKILKYVKQVGRALEYCHNDYNMVYSDMKPENVLMHNGAAKLIDFGLSHCEDGSTEFCQGTPEWSAPEKLLGQENTKKADVWSFGICILDALWQCSIIKEHEPFKQFVYKNGKLDKVKLICVYAVLLGNPSKEFMIKYMTNKQMAKFYKWKSHAPEWPPFALNADDDEIETLVTFLFDHVLCWDPEKRWSMTKVMNHPVFQKILDLDDEEKAAKKEWCWDDDLIDKNTGNQSDGARTDRQEFNKWWKKPDRKALEILLHKMVDMDITFSASQRARAGDPWYLRQTLFIFRRVSARLEQLSNTFDDGQLMRYCFMFVLFLWDDFNPHTGKVDLLSKRFESILYHIIRLSEYRCVLHESAKSKR
jgi:serine/threonine protein kinase